MYYHPLADIEIENSEALQIVRDWFDWKSAYHQEFQFDRRLSIRVQVVQDLKLIQTKTSKDSVQIITHLRNKGKDLIRVVRRLLGFRLIENGWYPMHASAVEYQGNGYVFFGPSFSGKTTTLLSLMAYGYNLVTNDKLFVRRFGADSFGLSLNTSIGIRDESLSVLKSCLPSPAKLDFLSTGSSQRQGNKSYYTPKTISEIFGIQVVPVIKISKVFRLDGDMTTSFPFNEQIEQIAFDNQSVSCLLPGDASIATSFKKKVANNFRFELLAWDKNLFEHNTIVRQNLSEIRLRVENC